MFNNLKRYLQAIKALPLIRDEHQALARELDKQVGALGKTLQEHEGRLATAKDQVIAALDDTKQVWQLWDLVREHEGRLDRAQEDRNKQTDTIENIKANLRELVADHQTPGHPNLVAANAGALEHRKLMDAEHHDMVRRLRDIEDGKVPGLEAARESLLDIWHLLQTHARKLDDQQNVGNDDHVALLDLLAWRHSLKKKATRKPAPARKAKPRHA